MLLSGRDCHQSALQVTSQICRVFQSNRQPDQAVGDTCRQALLRCEPAMRGGRRVGDGAFCITKIGGDGKDARGINKCPGICPAPFELKGNDATKAGLLAGRQRMLRM